MTIHALQRMRGTASIYINGCLFVCLTPMISATANPIAIKLSKKCRGHAPGGLCDICKKIARKLGRLWPINLFPIGLHWHAFDVKNDFTYRNMIPIV